MTLGKFAGARTPARKDARVARRWFGVKHVAVFAMALLAATGCARNRVQSEGVTNVARFAGDDAQLAAQAWAEASTTRGVSDLQPGDRIMVSFTAAPDLNSEQLVQMSGQINLPYIGIVETRNKTIAQIDEEITQRFASHLREPDLAVSVLEFNNPPAPNHLYMLGAIHQPGRYDVDGAITVLEAIATAGGFMPGAKPTDVIILRRRGDELLAGLEPIGGIIRGEQGQATLDFLRPGDVVYVPRTRLASAAEASQLVRTAIGWNGLVTSVNFRVFNDDF